MSIIRTFRRKGDAFAVKMSCGHSQIIMHRPGRQMPNIGQAWPCPFCPAVKETPPKMKRVLGRGRVT